MRTRLAVLAVAIVALTAGCAGLLPGDGGEADTGPTINESVLDSHQSQLDAAGNFSVRAEVTGGGGTTVYHANVDADRQRALVTTVGDEGLDEYRNETTRHIRASDSNGQPIYRVTEREFALSPLLMPSLYPVDAEYERTDTTTIDGTEVGVYEATGLGDDESVLGGEVTDFEGQNFTATLHVTDDGLIKRAEWSATARGQTVEAVLTVESVGDTSVTRPAWADSAVAAASNESQNDTSPAPSTRFDVTYNMDDDRVTFAHAGGDTLAGENLTAEVDTNETTRTVAVNASTIEQGDEFTVENVPPEATVRVVWSGGDQPETIYEYKAPTREDQEQADP